MFEILCIRRILWTGVIASILVSLSLSASEEQNPSIQSACIDGLKKCSVAAVSDAVDQVTGQRGFMSHKMRPLFRERAKFVGPAVTTLIQKSLKAATDPSGLKLTLETIDEGPVGSVLIVVVEGDADMTGIGGLMATTCKAREFAGAVIDGAARDVDEIYEMEFPVFSNSICPSTIVGRMVSVGKNIPVKCGGVYVQPGDIIVAGNDGVVVVPINNAEEVLAMAIKIDEKESKMVPLIKELKSIKKAVEKFKRM